ncbi:MAG: peptidyl-prolyl cis-trans isomerase [Flavobacteriaceae bacterium]|nr:peptidyl-prolyl cis-trans isomerase [Flavobacteriaceae bacterium]
MKPTLLLFILFFFSSCHFFEKEIDKEVIAKVGSHFLYRDDLENIVGPGTSKEDSIVMVNTFIDKWATQQLLLDKAKVNLSQEKLDAYDELVANYRTDLYTKGYVDIIATQSLNTEISESELQSFYEQNKENFLLNEDLVQLRYLHVGKENRSVNELKQQLFNFSEKDKKAIEEKSIQFKTISLNDSIWVEAQTVKDKIAVVTAENYSELLKKSNRLELQDSLGVYLIYVKDVLSQNDLAPLSYVKPTIEQIILNKRKLDIIKNLEKDILQDAIRTKKFEVFQ